jgi:hypothetical protein
MESAEREVEKLAQGSERTIVKFAKNFKVTIRLKESNNHFILLKSTFIAGD